MPTPASELAGAGGGIAAAWAGGDRGRAVIDRLLPALPALLSPGGEAFMVTVSENDPGGEGRAALGCAAAGVRLPAEAAAPNPPRQQRSAGTCASAAWLITSLPLPPAAQAEIMQLMEGVGLEASVALRRSADEEALTILRLARPRAAGVVGSGSGSGGPSGSGERSGRSCKPRPGLAPS